MTILAYASTQLHPPSPNPGPTAMLLAGLRLPANWLALHILHPAARFLHTLLHVFKGHARTTVIFALASDDSKERAMSVLTDAVEGFRLEDFFDLIECVHYFASAKASLPASVSMTALSNIRMTNLQDESGPRSVRSQGLRWPSTSRRSTLRRR